MSAPGTSTRASTTATSTAIHTSNPVSAMLYVVHQDILQPNVNSKMIFAITVERKVIFLKYVIPKRS